MAEKWPKKVSKWLKNDPKMTYFLFLRILRAFPAKKNLCSIFEYRCKAKKRIGDLVILKRHFDYKEGFDFWGKTFSNVALIYQAWVDVLGWW